ncbi:MAG TPA: GNAT family N-acetyltransferase [Devosia sp.]|uniref:GNAT family N-acetyltransferase n=1 Tax=Devosia sp. TaxID=1871048 RepID=UPI002F9218A8
MRTELLNHIEPRKVGEQPTYSAFRIGSPLDLALTELQPTSAFQAPVFISALLETIARSQGAEPVLIGVKAECGALVAILPFVLVKRLGVRVIEALDFHVVDYFAPTLAPAHPFDPDALWAAVRAALPTADAITLKKVPQRLYGRPHALTGASWLKPMGAAAFTTELGAEVQAKRFSCSRDVRRKSRKLESHGKLSFHVVNDQDGRAKLLDTMFQFRERRFLEMGRRDPLANLAYRDFYTELALAQNSIVRMFALCVDTEVIAAIYGIYDREILTLLISTMSSDPKWMVGSPGLVAFYRTMEWASSQGYQLLDLSVGSSGYKERFDTDRVELFEYQTALTFRGVPVVVDATLRRWFRLFIHANPRAGNLLRRLTEVRSMMALAR